MNSESEEVNTQLTKKINTANKNIKLLIDMVKSLEEKVEGIKATSPQTQEEKEKIKDIFEKKGVEKSKGDFNDKQKQYLRLLRNGKIKEPKNQPWNIIKL